MITKVGLETYQGIVNQKSYDIHFQPIVEVRKQRILGCEALFRAYCGENAENVSAEALFQYAGSHGKIAELDALSREKALENYIQRAEKRQLLFLNFESTLIPYYLDHFQEILDGFARVGIAHEQVVMEINEKNSVPQQLLRDFAQSFQKEGFLIALDDVGEGNSNLNRIAIVKPDIVKIDRYAITNIHTDSYKQIIVRSITEMCGQLGIAVIAEGVEEEEEIDTCMEAGIRFYQGYFFSKAVPLEEISAANMKKKAEGVADNYSAIMQKTLYKQYSRRKQHIVEKLLDCLRKSDDCDYEKELTESIREFPNVECVYLLDENGKQITETVFNAQVNFKNPNLYFPSRPGEYHNVDSYYYNAVISGGDVAKSRKYISAATGHNCVTYSCLYLSKNIKREILCVDFALSD